MPQDISTATTERFALLVERDDKAADLVRLLLQQEDFTVLRANDVEAVWQLAAQQTFSLITLNLDFPDSEKWDFLQRLREKPTLANVPVVMIAGPGDTNMALAGGAAAMLQKPVNRGQLKASLMELGLQPIQDRTHTILIVDDDPKAVEVIAGLLPMPGYAVVRAYGGSEAIMLAQRLLPDLILLDLMMPEVNGFDVVEALQRKPETASIPILVVTAKLITAEDRAILARHSELDIHVVQKAGFNRVRFIAEVRRALQPAVRSATHG